MNLKFWQRKPQASTGGPSSLVIEGRKYFTLDGSPIAGANGGTGRANGAVVACVSKIVSRAIEIPFVSTDPSVQRVLDAPSWLKSVDAAKFWERLYETVLYDGEATVFRASTGTLRIGRASSGLVIEGSGTETERIYRDVQTRMIGDQDEETIRVGEPDLCRVRWSDSAERPWSVCRKDALAYAELMDDLYQEGRFSRRITEEVEFTDAFTSKEAADEKLAEIQGILTNGRKQQSVALMKGMHFMPRHGVSSPPHEERLTQALLGVARVFGVPLQLLGVAQAKREVSIEEADAQLLRDAVIPLARKVASGLAKVFSRPVQVDMRQVGLPSRTGVAGLMMQLSQTGVLTINEIREQVGYGPTDGGDEFPTTAGAGDRTDSRETGNDQDQT